MTGCNKLSVSHEARLKTGQASVWSDLVSASSHLTYVWTEPPPQLKVKEKTSLHGRTFLSSSSTSVLDIKSAVFRKNRWKYDHFNEDMRPTYVSPLRTSVPDKPHMMTDVIYSWYDQKSVWPLTVLRSPLNQDTPSIKHESGHVDSSGFIFWCFGSRWGEFVKSVLFMVKGLLSLWNDCD